MIVADANLVAYFYFPGPFQQVAQQILRKDPLWFVPGIMTSEFRNITLNYVRAGRLNRKDAIDLVSRVEMVFAQRTRSASCSRVMELALASGCSAYDAEYVALAEMMNVRLVTKDAQVLKAFPRLTRTFEDLIG